MLGSAVYSSQRIEYKVEEPLNIAGVDQLYKGTLAGGIHVAVKVLPREDINTKREEYALKKLKHPNVIKLFHAEDDLDHSRIFGLELCVASLSQLFLNETDPKKYKGPMPTEVQVLLQLAKGLDYIHSQHLVHRNIHPDNVLISSTHTKRPVPFVKWAGFGVTKPVTDAGDFEISIPVYGKENWMAPEVLRWQQKTNTEMANAASDTYQNYEGEEILRGTIESDTFVAGILFFYFLVEGKHPFGTDPETIKANILIGNRSNFRRLTQDHFARDIVLQMLAKERSERPAMKNVIEMLPLLRIQDEVLRLCSLSNPHEGDLHRLNELMNMPDTDLDINGKGENGQTPFLLLCRYNLSENLYQFLEMLLAKGRQLGTPIDINHEDPTGFSAIMYICSDNYSNPRLVQVIEMLTVYKINLNVRVRETGWSILHFLFQNCLPKRNLVQVVSLLIRNGLDVNLKCKAGCNGLFYVRKFYPLGVDDERNRELIKLLKDNGADDVTCRCNCPYLDYLYCCCPRLGYTPPPPLDDD